MGRPRISPVVISFIKKIHAQNPTMSPEKIYEKLKNLNIENVPAPNTIAKYIQKLPHTPTGGQSWKTFIRNHQSLWAMDFFVVPTIGLKLLYVLVIINHHRRKIEYCSVTKHPTSAWLEQQIREATPWNNTPKYLLHDNGPMFISHRFQAFLKNSNIKSIRTTPHSPWQNGICERVVKTIKMELVHHIIPLNEKHLHHMLKEYIDKYYNPQRTHQAIDCETPIKSKPFPPTSISDTVLKATPILNGLYHEYSKMVS